MCLSRAAAQLVGTVPIELVAESYWRRLTAPAFGIATVVLLSNFLVQFPINRWLTWGAFVYPVGYLITELSNRWAGPRLARKVAWVGFFVGAVLSAFLATPRIAAASSSAFLTSQMLDISVFNRFRRGPWWQAPLAASAAASVIDTFLFFAIAFYGTQVPWLALAFGDLSVKICMAAFLLLPYRLAIGTWAVQSKPTLASTDNF